MVKSLKIWLTSFGLVGLKKIWLTSFGLVGVVWDTCICWDAWQGNLSKTRDMTKELILRKNVCCTQKQNQPNLNISGKCLGWSILLKPVFNSDLKSFLCEQHFLERNQCGRDLSVLSSSTRNVTWSLLPFHFLSNQPLFSLEGDISLKCALLNVSLNPNTSLWDFNEKD